MKLLSVVCACVLLIAGVFVLAAPPAGDRPEPAKARPSDDVKTLAKDSNEFGADLYKQLAGKEGNLFFSPGSIYPALGMLYNGARGETAAEMVKTLHLSLPVDKLNAAFAEQARLLNPPAPLPAKEGEKPKERPYQLSIANALWAQEGYKFNPEYLALTAKFFGAELTAVNFVTAAEAAREKINGWVEKKTNDKIKDLIPQGALTADTRMVLTNAIYFKGNWAEPFKKEDTRDEPFRTPAKRGDAAAGERKAPMMHRSGKYGYLKGDGFAAVELPYAGDELAMQVFLPDEVDGLAEFENKLSADNFAKWTFHSRDVNLSLPKFKMTREFTLNEQLARLGMPLAFSSKADLSGIGGSPGELYVSSVLHKAFVDVNEEGTEAAAATGIVVGVTAMPPPPVEFKADHPFLFIIRHKPTGGVLFIGRLVDPKDEGK